jgi:hypothetical protein
MATYQTPFFEPAMPSAIPPPPPGWNKTLADLFAEMKRRERRSVGSPEREWALAYERSLLPADFAYPRAGDCFEAIKEVTVDYQIAWHGPISGDGSGVLLPGDLVIIDPQLNDPQPLLVYAKPVPYGLIEARLVLATTREDRRYRGINLALKTTLLASAFRRVPPASP